jgi:hypothetical protein
MLIRHVSLIQYVNHANLRVESSKATPFFIWSTIVLRRRVDRELIWLLTR